MGGNLIRRALKFQWVKESDSGPERNPIRKMNLIRGKDESLIC